MQATIEIITNPIDVTQGTSETTQTMTFDISPSYIKGDDGHTPVITATKNGKVTTIKSDGVAIATINDGEDGTTDYNELTNKPTIPTKTSELTNDSGFLTAHQSLSDYYTKSEINGMIGNVESILAEL